MFIKIINLLIFIKNNINTDLNVVYFTTLFILLAILGIKN